MVECAPVEVDFLNAAAVCVTQAKLFAREFAHSMTPSRALSNAQIARAALIVLFGFVASGVLGLVRTAIINAAFGAGDALDAFVWAQRLPELIFVLVAGGALGSSFIPVYARLRERDDAEESAWRLASAVMTLSALAAGVLSLLVVLLAPLIVTTVLAPAAAPEVQHLTAALMRIMMVTPFIFSISGLLMGILQAHQLFLLPSIAISMNNIGLMIGALVIARMLPPGSGVAQVGDSNVYGLAYGAALSALLHLLVQLPGLRQVKARLRLRLDWRIPGVAEVMRLMGPRVLGLAVVQINFVVNAMFTSGMISGSAAALVTAFTLMFFALGIIGQSLGSAVFPSLAAMAAAEDFDGFKDRLASALRSVLFLSFPAMIALILLGVPLVTVLYQRNEWTAEHSQAAAWALAFYAIGMAGFALLEVLSRAFYALSDTWTPVKVGTAAMISNIVLSIIFIEFIGDWHSLAHGPFAGLALANALTTNIEALALWLLLRRRIGPIHDRAVLTSAGKALIAALAMGLVLWFIEAALAESGALVTLLAGGVIGGAVFFGLSLLLRLEEATAVPNMLLRRLRR
ncbi:MAG: murein biosynthesis integral membrane protein MurJ [Anaerolineae bacterium]|nr:murein biosynthesis integral membrane protein MurJ [Anaerolineae bacterium]